MIVTLCKMQTTRSSFTAALSTNSHDPGIIQRRQRAYQYFNTNGQRGEFGPSLLWDRRYGTPWPHKGYDAHSRLKYSRFEENVKWL